MAVPLGAGTAAAPCGVLVVGMSPYRPLDENYRSFVRLLAGSLSSAIADARSYQAERDRVRGPRAGAEPGARPLLPPNRHPAAADARTRLDTCVLRRAAHEALHQRRRAVASQVQRLSWRYRKGRPGGSMDQGYAHPPAGGLAVTTDHPTPGIAVVRVRGELDRDTEPQFTRCLRELGTEVVVVDLGDVTFVAARGVDAVVDEAARAGLSQVRLRIVGRRSAAVVRAFSAAGLLGLLEPHDDVETLLRALPRGEDGETS